MAGHLTQNGHHGHLGHYGYNGHHGHLVEQAIQQWIDNGGVENLIMQVLYYFSTVSWEYKMIYTKIYTRQL